MCLVLARHSKSWFMRIASKAPEKPVRRVDGQVVPRIDERVERPHVAQTGTGGDSVGRGTTQLCAPHTDVERRAHSVFSEYVVGSPQMLSLIHISEPTRQAEIS